MQIQGTNISMIRGDTESITVSINDTEGNKIPLVDGDTIYLTVKQSITTEEKVLQKVIQEFEDGEAIIEITPDNTKTLQFKNYIYDIQLSRADGTVSTIIPPSSFTIRGEVTYE